VNDRLDDSLYSFNVLDARLKPSPRGNIVFELDK
jgi:hypothetical protein